MPREYKKIISNLLDESISEQNDHYNYFYDGSNFYTENGKEISNRGTEALDNSFYMLQLNKWGNWLDKYYAIKDSLTEYAPEHVSLALNSYLQENPSPFDCEHTQYFSVFSIINNFEKVFKSSIEEEPKLNDALGYTFHDILNKNKFQNTTLIFTSLLEAETPFIRNIIGFNLGEEILKSEENIFIASHIYKKLQDEHPYREEQIKKSNHKDYYISQNNLLELLEKIEIKQISDKIEKDFFSDLDNPGKAKIFNFLKNNYSYKNKNDTIHIYIKFLSDSGFSPNEEEFKEIKKGIPFNKEDEYLPTLETLLKRNMLLNTMKSEKNNTNNDIGSHAFKI